MGAEKHKSVLSIRRFEGISLDTRDPSYVRATFGLYSTDALTAYYDACYELVARMGPPFVMLVDARQARVPSASERQLSVTFWEQAGPTLKGRLVAVAYVTDDPELRAALRVQSWFRGPPAPTETFDQLSDAEEWLATLRTGAELPLGTEPGDGQDFSGVREALRKSQYPFSQHADGESSAPTFLKKADNFEKPDKAMESADKITSDKATSEKAPLEKFLEKVAASEIDSGALIDRVKKGLDLPDTPRRRRHSPSGAWAPESPLAKKRERRRSPSGTWMPEESLPREKPRRRSPSGTWSPEEPLKERRPTEGRERRRSPSGTWMPEESLLKEKPPTKERRRLSSGTWAAERPSEEEKERARRRSSSGTWAPGRTFDKEKDAEES